MGWQVNQLNTGIQSLWLLSSWTGSLIWLYMKHWLFELFKFILAHCFSISCRIGTPMWKGCWCLSHSNVIKPRTHLWHKHKNKKLVCCWWKLWPRHKPNHPVLCSRYMKGHGQHKHIVLTDRLEVFCLHHDYDHYDNHVYNCLCQWHKHKKNKRILYPYADILILMSNLPIYM